MREHDIQLQEYKAGSFRLFRPFFPSSSVLWYARSWPNNTATQHPSTGAPCSRALAPPGNGFVGPNWTNRQIDTNCLKKSWSSWSSCFFVLVFFFFFNAGRKPGSCLGLWGRQYAAGCWIGRPGVSLWHFWRHFVLWQEHEIYQILIKLSNYNIISCIFLSKYTTINMLNNKLVAVIFNIIIQWVIILYTCFFW